ncbi:MAG: hypothetical protein AAGU11_21805 [Syntrophobacteraceae bacterium]
MLHHINTSSIWICTILVTLDVVTVLTMVVGILMLIRLALFGGGAWLWAQIGVLIAVLVLTVVETYAQWRHLLALRRNHRRP